MKLKNGCVNIVVERKNKGVITLADNTIATNRKAFHDYFVDETIEAGIELCGTEVKAIRLGGVNLKDSWISIDNGEAFIRNMHISP